MRKVLIIASLAVAIFIFAWFYPFADRASEIGSYRLARVEKGPIVSAVSSSGTLNAVITVQVGSQVSGQIKELFADYNSEVSRGQVIARIDPENFQARVLQAEAELDVARANVSIQKAAVDRAQAELRNAQEAFAASRAQTEKANVGLADTKRDLDRKQQLFKGNIIPQSEIDKAVAARDQALAQLSAAQAEQRAQASLVGSREAALKGSKAQVEHSLAQVKQREAALHQAKVDMEHTIIRSPVDGVVIERNVDIGQTVAASLQAPTLFTIAQDLRQMQVETDLDEADIGRILVGQPVSFTVDAFPGKEFRGVVKQIRMAPMTVQNVVTYTVVVSADNAEQRLLPGMTANVKIVVEERHSAVKVPNGALRFQPDHIGNDQRKPPERSSPAGASGTDRMKRLVDALNLDENQQAQLGEIFAEMRERIGAMRRQGASPEDMRAEIDRLRLRNREAILAMLTQEQREKFNQLDAARASSPVTQARVWVVGPDGKPSSLDILAGISDGSFTEVIRGDLRPGQELIIGTSQPSRQSSGGGKMFRF
jgi:HlyD family secretion protein